MSAEVFERIIVAATTDAVYAALAQVDRMARWSPECFAVWVYQRTNGQPRRFVGFNRRKGYVWFTTCQVVVAEPGREFAFDVFTFGQPVARWGYRLAAVPEASGPGATEVTEYWQDRRNKAATRLGRIFTGKVTLDRPTANRAGMRTTLERLKRELEARPAGA